ncbi:hypothetical protein W97_08170 [Coniosporium apollinis CBS 100218]|uniref:Aminoacyl-tRNA synthetase class II (D/K/N) domain-containing protein n=1 Tax=Coniosporium apollinis (strain CBS 100218) TaxID=1168221 RepID=R7Z416_CONA1|nr:uncharacterized protein W97_08170 [Coniosporium apollinis CBS 100218]EON68912.1 hypothetical protein W97_08170 [Coniosporium apollinis CBS 100218]
MLEVEMNFVDTLNPIMDLVEDMLRDIALRLQDSTVGQELLTSRSSSSNGEEASAVTHDVLLQRWQGLAQRPWPRVTYAEAIARLQQATSQKNVVFEFEPTLESGLQAEHERFLAEHVGQGSPVFVTDYPRIMKPFYMAPSRPTSGNTDPVSTVACFDLLVPDLCELVGGSLREHRWSALHDAMESHGLLKPKRVFGETHDASGSINPAVEMQSIPTPSTEVSSLQWYLDLRRYGSVPHGGFGLGFDRLLGYLSGVSNLRDTVAFPRWYKRCDA